MLKYIDLSIEGMEKVVFVLVIIFCVSYIVQYIVYPIVIFPGADVEYEDNFRLRMHAQGLSSLGYFFGLNKYLYDNKKTGHLLLSILCLSIVFLMGFRTMLIIIIVFSLILTIRLKGLNWNFIWYFVILFGGLSVLMQFSVFSNRLVEMQERQQTEVLSNTDYIRVIQFQYFTNDHFKSGWEYIFGSGLPSLVGQESYYGRYMQSLLDIGITWVDFGLLSISWIIGPITVLAMIGYSFKSSLLKVYSNYYYLGIWFGYLVFCSFTTQDFYRPGNFIIQAIVLYMIEKISIIYKIEQNENRNFNLSSST